MIFYFSGTGNSRWIADELSRELSDKRIISIGSATTNSEFRYEIHSGERIGWVFPIYSWGMPPIVTEFIRKVQLIDYSGNFSYMCCSCGDDIALTAECWRNELSKRGFTADVAYSVTMPNNYILLAGFDTDPKDVETAKLDNAPKRIADIVSQIIAENRTDSITKGRFAWIKSKVINPIFNKQTIRSSRFSVNTESCINCGKCANNCPVNNINMVNGTPQWSDNCTQCLGCIHICPTRATNYGTITIKRGRYYHP